MIRRSLSPVALSRLTWTADDRQAWNDAYRAAIWCAAIRDARTVVARRDARVALIGYSVKV